MVYKNPFWHETVMQKDSRASQAVEVGRRLAEARKAAGFSQITFAKRLGFENAASLSNWENGWAMLPPEFAPKIFLLTKIDANFLYMNDPSNLPNDLYEKLFPPSPKGAKKPIA